ncbi:hypothetical protein EGW08_017086 [Elysia chlorotica]|uniref:Uncharacterized protein n=1 Tax=Elysia chlorotica TaxID=188477 RepID=A0A3S1B9A2_ELYCH|nr:hypothetical protein EGW08_017086 [Elysia chlorotica]
MRHFSPLASHHHHQQQQQQQQQQHQQEDVGVLKPQAYQIHQGSDGALANGGKSPCGETEHAFAAMKSHVMAGHTTAYTPCRSGEEDTQGIKERLYSSEHDLSRRPGPGHDDQEMTSLRPLTNLHEQVARSFPDQHSSEFGGLGGLGGLCGKYFGGGAGILATSTPNSQVSRDYLGRDHVRDYSSSGGGGGGYASSPYQASGVHVSDHSVEKDYDRFYLSSHSDGTSVANVSAGYKHYVDRQPDHVTSVPGPNLDDQPGCNDSFHRTPASCVSSDGAAPL